MDTGSGYATDTSSTSKSSGKRKSDQEVQKKRHRSCADPSWRPCGSENEEKRKLRSVSSWTLSRVKDYGLYFENKTSSFSDFYELFKTCDGKSKRGFLFPLQEEEKILSDTLVDQTNVMIDKYGVEKEEHEMWSVYFNWVDKKEDCVEAVRNLTKNIPNGKPMLLKSHFALIDFYHALNDHFQEKIDNHNSSTEVTEEPYTELLSKFLEIFLLTPRRGIRKSVMEITGRTESSTPDLRLTVDTALNLFVVEVVEVKRVQCKLDESVPFDINKSLHDRVLGQHAGELLIDFQKSVFGDLEAVFGIICMQTSLIFTCLKISLVHYENIQEYGTDLVSRGMRVDDSFQLLKDKSDGEEDGLGDDEESKQKKRLCEKASLDKPEKKERKSGTIFYTKPYNYLVSKDRRQIMEFLFWIGINSNRKFNP